MVSDAMVEGVSGAVGGMVALTTTYPLMTIATLQAVRRKQASGSNKGDDQQPPKNNGTMADVLELLRDGGWQALFRGIEPALLGTAVSQGLYFYFYSSLRQAAVALQNAKRPAGTGRDTTVGVGTSLLVASIAGCANVVCTTPIWVVATRMQATRRVSGGERGPRPLAVAREVYNEYGITGFWKGVIPSLVMVSNPTVQYVLYEFLTAQRNKRRALARQAARKPSALEIFGFSAVAKLGATLVTYPLLLIKTRMQSARKGAEGDPQYKGTLHAVRSIYKHEGLPGFYSGMHTKMVQSVVAAALLFMIKEELAETTGRLLRGGPVKAVM